MYACYIYSIEAIHKIFRIIDHRSQEISISARAGSAQASSARAPWRIAPCAPCARLNEERCGRAAAAAASRGRGARRARRQRRAQQAQRRRAGATNHHECAGEHARIICICEKFWSRHDDADADADGSEFFLLGGRQTRVEARKLPGRARARERSCSRSAAA